mgnify:CR=1 FL=1
MKSQKINRISLLFLIFLLFIHLSYADLLSVETLSPSSANLCGIYPNNVTITAENIQNNGNQTIENVTATLISEPNNGGLNIISPSLDLGSITPGLLSINLSWQVRCGDAPGEYILYVDFFSAEENLGSSQEETVSNIVVYANDNTPPVIESYSPTGVIPTSFLTLEVVTTEDATCKYSTIPEVTYANQQYQFQITGGKSHKVPLQNMVDNLYYFYIRCKDAAGNEAPADYVASVEVNAPPTATISLSKPSPLSLGTAEVTVMTSEAVKPVPSLSYSCNENAVSVPLTGSGTSWKGYIILGQANLNEVCSFSFSSIDLSGNPGSYTSSGNVFLIDTQAPSAPTLLTAVEQKGFSAKLHWRYGLEEIKQFNIYRVLEDEGDFFLYETTAQNSFTDTALKPGKTYSYSVSAVDEAGNEGPLSDEVSISIQGTLSAVEKTIGTESNYSDIKALISLSEIDAVIKEADSLLEEFNSLRTKLKADNDKVLSLRLLDRIKEAKVLLLKKKEELGILKNNDLAYKKTREEFEAISSEIKSIKHQVIANVSYGQELSFLQKPNNELVSMITGSYLEKKHPAIGEAEKKDYFLSAKKLQSAAVIKAGAQEVEIKYLNGTKEKLLLIKKEVVFTDSLLVAGLIIEYVPKELAFSVAEMILNGDVEILGRDPLLLYHLDEPGNFNYSYILKTSMDEAKIEEIVTVPVPGFSASKEFSDYRAGKNFLTGNVVSTANSLVNKIVIHGIGIYDIGIVAGVLLIVVLLIYSFVYSEKTNSVQNDPLFTFHGFFSKTMNQKDKNEFISPYQVSEEYKKAGLTPLKDQTPFLLLNNVDDSINSLEFEKAVKFYHLFSVQNGSPLCKEKIRRGYPPHRVKKKMSLLTKKILLEYRIEKGECQNMACLLNEIADLYNELLPGALEKEKRFFQRFKKVHREYSQQLLKK